MALVESENTIEVLRRTGFSFKKSLGPNFLIDPLVLQRIIDAACLTEDDCALEIGPGIGTMTEALSEAAGRVVAVELDNRLIPILEENLRGCENVTIVHGDILKTDLRKLSEEYCDGKPFKAVANLPYSVTTPALLKLLSEDAPITSATLMVQKEVAERMMAKPGTKAYGALSLAVQYRAEISVAANVPRNCFIPRPEVDSQVVHLQCFSEPPVRTEDSELMFRLIRASFNERRKTLVNGLSNGKIGYSKEEILRAVGALGKGEAVRGEMLSLEDFARLADIFKNREF